MGKPPKKTEIFTSFMYLLKRSYSLLIWKANSRVWHNTITDTYEINMQINNNIMTNYN